jgi:hypothetical protein
MAGAVEPVLALARRASRRALAHRSFEFNPPRQGSGAVMATHRPERTVERAEPFRRPGGFGRAVESRQRDSEDRGEGVGEGGGKMSGLKRAFMGSARRLEFFRVLADSRAFGEDDAMARMRKYRPFAGGPANGSNRRDEVYREYSLRHESRTPNGAGRLYHVYLAPNAPRTPFRFSFSPEPTANS